MLAGGAWLTAKAQLNNDFRLFGGVITAEFNIAFEQRRDRLNLFYVLERHATTKRSAARPFLIFQGQTWTYKETYDTVLKYGSWLKKTYAIGKGEVVAIDFMNSPTFIFLWMGLWSIGAQPAFINYNLTAEPLLHTIKTSSARLVIVEEDIWPKFTRKLLEDVAAENIEVVLFSTAIQQQIASTEGIREPDSLRGGVDRAGMAALIYTSGTTGLPKPAIVSWRKFWLSSFMPFWASMKTSDRFYTCMPLYHSSAAILCTIPTLTTGASLIIGRRFSTSTFWPEVRQHNATMIQYVGETCRYLLAARPQIDPVTGANLDKAHNVRLAFGNGLRPDVWDRFKDRFGIETIGEFYSATEGVSGTWNLSSNSFSSGAVGRFGAITRFLLPLQIAIVEVDWTIEAPARNPKNQNFCIQVKRGEPGELLYKVDPDDISAKYQGYFNNPKASDGKLLRDVLVKGDAYFRTGDIIRLDQEGRMFFCDRIGDTFRWKSENVSTAEVGEVLGRHPRILEANVYGVELPHHDGRAGCAAVLFDEAQGPVTEQLLEDVAKHAKNGLPKYAVPIFLRVVRTVEATGNNKQQKAGLRNEGVDPNIVKEDKLVWLKGERYVPFEGKQWQEMTGGRVRL